MEPKLVIIITGARHGSTTLCRILGSKLKNFKIEFEIFRNGVENTENNKKYPIDTIKNKLIEYNNYGFKIFGDQLSHIQVENILKYYKNNLLVIFLRRSLQDSYKSLCKSLKTGNWGTTPEQQLTWKKDGWKNTPPNYSNYVKNIEHWFSFTKNLCQKYNIKNSTIKFEDVIVDEKIEDIICKLFKIQN